MTRTLAEILLFGSLAFNACLMIFVAGVLRRVMNEMDEPALKKFLVSFVYHSKRSPFIWAVFYVPLFGAIPYFYFYGFANRWVVAGLSIWLVAGSIAKAVKLPIYETVAALGDGDVVELRENLHKMNAANIFQAIMNFVAAVLVLAPFAK